MPHQLSYRSELPKFINWCHTNYPTDLNFPNSLIGATPTILQIWTSHLNSFIHWCHTNYPTDLNFPNSLIGATPTILQIWTSQNSLVPHQLQIGATPTILQIWTSRIHSLVPHQLSYRSELHKLIHYCHTNYPTDLNFPNSLIGATPTILQIWTSQIH